MVPADGSAQEGLDTKQLQQRLAAAEQDRDKARKQLNRCAFLTEGGLAVGRQGEGGGGLGGITLQQGPHSLGC